MSLETKPKVLVIGATGFVGLNVVEHLLANGYRISCLVRKTSKVEPLKNRGVGLICGDITDGSDTWSAKIAGFDFVFHLAGASRAIRRRTLFDVNVNGLGNVLNACQACETPPVVIYASSLAAAGPSDFDRPHNESDLCKPVSNYGASKLMAESVAREFSGRVPISIVRPPIVIGPHDTNGVTMFRSIARWGVHPIPGRSAKKFSIVHVDDLSAALVQIARGGERLTAHRDSEGVYYVAADEIPTFHELGDMIGKALGSDRVIKIRVPNFGVWVLGGFNSTAARLTGRLRLIDWDKAREGTAGSWACSNKKIRSQLEFKPAFPLQERITQTAQWFGSAGWLGAQREME